MFKTFITVLALAICCSCFSQTIVRLNKFAVTNNIAKLSRTIQLKEFSVPRATRILSKTTTYCSSTSCSVLPVKLLSFTATRLSKLNVDLKWETLNEYNSAGFEIERSLGNTTQFIKVGFEISTNNAAVKSKYLFTDANDFAGTSYYRLKQVDKDNGYVYSNIVAVKGYLENEKIVIYPNPVKSTLHLQIFAINSSKAVIAIYDASGRQLQQSATFLTAGNNTKSISLPLPFHGSYVVKVERANEMPLIATFIKSQ